LLRSSAAQNLLEYFEWNDSINNLGSQVRVDSGTANNQRARRKEAEQFCRGLATLGIKAPSKPGTIGCSSPGEFSSLYFTVIVSDLLYAFPLLSQACTTTFLVPTLRVSEVRSELAETLYLETPSTKIRMEVIGAEPVA
jgi:hypothetical protein